MIFKLVVTLWAIMLSVIYAIKPDDSRRTSIYDRLIKIAAELDPEIRETAQLVLDSEVAARECDSLEKTMGQLKIKLDYSEQGVCFVSPLDFFSLNKQDDQDRPELLMHTITIKNGKTTIQILSRNYFECPKGNDLTLRAIKRANRPPGDIVPTSDETGEPIGLDGPLIPYHNRSLIHITIDPQNKTSAFGTCYTWTANNVESTRMQNFQASSEISIFDMEYLEIRETTATVIKPVNDKYTFQVGADEADPKFKFIDQADYVAQPNSVEFSVAG